MIDDRLPRLMNLLYSDTMVDPLVTAMAKIPGATPDVLAEVRGVFLAALPSFRGIAIDAFRITLTGDEPDAALAYYEREMPACIEGKINPTIRLLEPMLGEHLRAMTDAK